MRAATLSLAILCALAAPVIAGCEKPGHGAETPPEEGATLEFRKNGAPVKTLSKSEILAIAPPETITAIDPYYKKSKTFRAIPFVPVIERALGPLDAAMRDGDFILRAKDGYSVPISWATLSERGGAYIAFEDVDVPGWEPIGPQRANPGPFYLVWKHPDQQDLEQHPRPWQLASIEAARVEATFPSTVPTGMPPDSDAVKGFLIFRQQCIACHSINREGGRVGPDLNVPQSIVEYRPRDQIKAYIKDPRAFRYGNMPSHEHLKGEELDRILAYFDAMKDRKRDPEAAQRGKP